MSNKSFQSKLGKFMSGKGFYLALAVCLIGTGTAAWVAVDRTLGSIDQNNTNLLNSLSSSQEEAKWDFPTTEEAGNEQSGISVSSAPSSSSSTPSSSLEQSVGQSQASEPLDSQQTQGTPVYCVANGTVTETYQDPMWGYTVEISHGEGLTSIYCGLAKDLMVQKGDTVKISQQIGTVDTVPAEIALEEHLHFGMKCDGKWVDPLTAMNKIK